MRICAACVLGIGLAMAGCSGDGGKAKPDICDQLQDKHDACATGKDVSATCDPSRLPSQMQCALADCTLKTDCQEFTTYVDRQFMSAAVVSCYADCGVVLTGLFQCADGSGAVPTEAQCDGIAACPDGSDEAGCS